MLQAFNLEPERSSMNNTVIFFALIQIMIKAITTTANGSGILQCRMAVVVTLTLTANPKPNANDSDKYKMASVWNMHEILDPKPIPNPTHNRDH